MSARTVSIGIALATVAGGVALVLGGAVEPARAAFAYLTAWTYALTVVVGALFWVLIGHTTSAVWFVAVRRVAERLVAAMPALAVLTVPLMLLRGKVYVTLDAYSSVAAVTVRTAVYFAILCALSALCRRWSLRQDMEQDPAYVSRLRVLGSVGLPLSGFALTFASFDWLMALDDRWGSTIYGVYVAAGAALAGLALVALLAARDRAAGRLPSGPGVPHFFAIGKLFLMLVLFWAYTGFSQLLLVWIADLPSENAFYVDRSRGSWAAVCWVIGVGHFALPLAALLSHRLKRSPARIAAVGAYLVVLHYVDVYWLVMPALDRAGPRPHWLDLAAFVAVAGACATWVRVKTRGESRIPAGDPRLGQSLAFEDA